MTHGRVWVRLTVDGDRMIERRPLSGDLTWANDFGLPRGEYVIASADKPAADNDALRAALTEIVRLEHANVYDVSKVFRMLEIARRALARPTPAQTTPAEPSDTASTNPLEHTE